MKHSFIARLSLVVLFLALSVLLSLAAPAVQAEEDNLAWNISADRTVRLSKNGEFVTGFFKVDGKLYYFDENGILQKYEGWKTIDGNRYYFFHVESNDWQYYAATGPTTLSRYETENGKEVKYYDYYYFDEMGRMQTGLVNARYGVTATVTEYFNEETGRLETGFKTIGGDTYYFHWDVIVYSDGVSPVQFKKDVAPCATGWFQVPDDGWYYFAEDGKLVGREGDAALNGLMRDSHWKQENGHWVYLDDNGSKHTGWLYDSGWYYFAEDGAAYAGWLQDDSKWYYFAGTEGKASIAFRTIDGVRYHFDMTTCAMDTGWKYFSYSNRWFYFGEDGAIRTGWNLIDDEWYFFDDEGIMQTGWTQVGNTWYLLSQSGTMTTGWHQENGIWYYFGNSGAMATGWKEIDGAWYCFKDSGEMATGWFEDKSGSNSVWYYFDASGAMATGWKEIGGRWEMFADSGAWLYTWASD